MRFQARRKQDSKVIGRINNAKYLYSQFLIKSVILSIAKTKLIIASDDFASVKFLLLRVAIILSENKIHNVFKWTLVWLSGAQIWISGLFSSVLRDVYHS